MDLIIVTPEGTLFHGPTDQVEFPSDTGELGILPGHVPLMVGIAGGELRIYRGTAIERFAVAGGFAEINPREVRVMATFASVVDERFQIDLACQRAQQALETAAAESPAIIAGELAALRTDLLRLSQQRLLRKRH
jgi:F-type H+-transporting ATPase subunit epsilon